MSEPTPTPPQPPDTTHRAPKRRRWPWVIAVIAALFVGVGIGASSADESTSVEAAGQVDTTGLEQDLADAERTVEQLTAQRDELNGVIADYEAIEDELLQEAAALEEREAAVAAREEAVTATEETVAANSVGDGVWTVGVDIEPGTYRAVDVSADCYWAVLVTGSNGADIVENGIPGGGNPSVTVEEGHDFETVRCGEWVKQ